MSRENSLLVLEGLLKGLEIQVNDVFYFMDHNKRVFICIDAKYEANSPWIETSISLKDFVRTCNAMSDQQIIEMISKFSMDRNMNAK